MIFISSCLFRSVWRLGLSWRSSTLGKPFSEVNARSLSLSLSLYIYIYMHACIDGDRDEDRDDD